MAKITRCAVYTRKSTEHNLDLEFNSLEAQREACEAYVKSQVHEGWRLNPDRYDDGGISGATLERPDLQRLLDDVRAGKIDTVVVYKVDRLTRSLADFAKLVELFDAHAVSFVSVTQAFNTTTSMGRLTLNVLLSFAQFEREVIGERVRDKIAASKRKGLWTGGTVPLGYVNKDKKLVVVPGEATSVRWIFQRYVDLGAIGPLLQELDRAGIKTKERRYANGRVVGGGRFGKGGLNHLLKNRCYVGELVHRGQVHPADHDAIVERQLFDAVQVKLAANAVARRLVLRGAPHLLTGLIFDSAGNRMSPSHSVKKGVRYRYYVSQAVQQRRKEEAGVVSHVPAPDLEGLVGELLRQRVGLAAPTPTRDVLEAYIQRITVQSDTVEVLFRSSQDDGNVPSEKVEVRWARKPFRATKGVALAPSEPALGAPRRHHGALLKAIGKARLWIDEMMAEVPIGDIAKREGKCDRQIRLLLRLAFTPPNLVRELAAGSAPPMTVTQLAKTVPLIWP